MATEKRLIDANKLWNALPADDGLLMYQVKRAIRDAPTVDAVEVVRCKDCKHYMTIHCICDGCCISDEWYCADGERRTDHV